MSSPDVDDIAHAAAVESREVRRDFRQTLLSGIALTVPFLITVLVLMWALNAAANALAPLVDVLLAVEPTDDLGRGVTGLLAAALVFGLIFLVGLAAQHGPDTSMGARVDALMEDIPGVGTIYTSVERMSDVLLEGDTDSFQEVKLVEFPHEGSYALAFLTATPSAEIKEAAGRDDMLTLFVPMAPNPVMGGHLVNLPRERVHDVDLTVEEGMEAIMTTGLAIDEDAGGEASGTSDS